MDFTFDKKKDKKIDQNYQNESLTLICIILKINHENLELAWFSRFFLKQQNPSKTFSSISMTTTLESLGR